MNTDNDSEDVRIEGSWEPQAKCKLNGKDHRLPKRFIKNNGIHTIENPKLYDEIVKWLRRGYEVRLFDSIRLYHYAETDLKSMGIVAQVLRGTRVRECCKDLPLKIVRGKQASTAEEALEAQRRNYEEANQPDEAEEETDPVLVELPEVTPDTVIRCPRCNTRIRVGKKISA